MMRALIRFGAVVLLFCALPSAPAIAGPPSAALKIKVEVFRGNFASVNAFIISNGKSLVLIDTLRKSRETLELAKRIKAIGLPLTHILITHGHTDHFTGMPVMMKEFPEARIVVANEAIRKDIKAYAIYMDGLGATAAEPPLESPLRPRSASNPTGFDYERNIHILKANLIQMHGGGTLRLTTDYKPAEADHMTTVYIPEANALFLSDFGYNRIHFWMGDDISRSDIANWREEIVRIKVRYQALNPAIYPGHGAPDGLAIFDDGVRYIDDMLRIASTARSREEAAQEMTRLYPDYGEADFFLKYSIENLVRP